MDPDRIPEETLAAMWRIGHGLHCNHPEVALPEDGWTVVHGLFDVATAIRELAAAVERSRA